MVLCKDPRGKRTDNSAECEVFTVSPPHIAAVAMKNKFCSQLCFPAAGGACRTRDAGAGGISASQLQRPLIQLVPWLCLMTLC